MHITIQQRLTQAARQSLFPGIILAGIAASATAYADPLPNRPDFQLPFPCGAKVELKTYAGHNPDDKKIDMYRYGMPTGSPITASAGGYVHQIFEPGGIEIRHGNGWFSTYMHMTNRIAQGSTVKQGDVIGLMGEVGSPGAPHLHYEQLYAPGLMDADNQHIVNPVLQGEWLYMQPDAPLTRTSTNCSGSTDNTPPKPAGAYWADTFSDASGYSTPGGSVSGTLYKGTNYVYCKAWGPNVQSGSSFNHWWLKTDLDLGPAKQWVSAFYLSRWGNDEAKDNSGVVIATCPDTNPPPAPAPTTKYWVDTWADASGRATPGGSVSGTLYKGTSYVYCKAWGPNAQSGSNYNHWWLRTDLDVGPANQWVSALMLSRWGNDQARDNNGTVIPSCP